MRTLYLSQTGMTEPLGQTQVLAYLEGLAHRGVDLEIVSFEPAGTPEPLLAKLRHRLEAGHIRWSPLVRSSSHALRTKLRESGLGVVNALRSALLRRPRIVHARSYFAAAIADVVATTLPGAKMLFDCRGMLGDEYVDAGHWTTDRLEYRLVKSYERRAFRAPGVVVLTEAVRRWLDEHGYFGQKTSVEVIPCCVDTTRFRPDAEARQRTRRRLGLEDRLVVVYSGTLGSWYLEAEMAALVARLQRAREDTVFLVLTRAPTDSLRAAVRAHGIPADALRVERVAPEEMHEVLPAGDLGLCFLRPCFSKVGSSPTKVAEYLACGMPVVVNENIGDLGDLAGESGAAVVMPDFSTRSVDQAAERALSLATQPFSRRSADTAMVAQARFALDAVGLARYERLYTALDRG